jgi:hypothetical protein
MRHWFHAAVAASVSALLSATAAIAQSDPPGRVGRISYLQGTVSFHDDDEQRWSPALLNFPVTSGGAIWTEPGGRAEVVVAGTRLRLQGTTQIDVETLDDEQFRLVLSQGRVDVRGTDITSYRPFEVRTPRGAVRLLEDGDYMIDAGTTQDPTRIGVRRGLAQFVDPAGDAHEIRAGEVGTATGGQSVALAIERASPPPLPPEWAVRDRVVADRPPQYLPTAVTGYEDLDAYGNWIAGGEYGQVWVPRSVPAGWAPYRHGRWVWVRPWGWTWVDDAPWGFAPFHYGRWTQYGGRWVWVPPARRERAVYAPAIVGFVGGLGAELALGVGRGPSVGWFPLGPREVYVPPYTTNRTYIRNINVTNVTNITEIDRRIEYVERRGDARRDDRRETDRWNYINRRHATVVPVDAFVRSQPTKRSALQVRADQLARAEVAPVAAPPAARIPERTSPASPDPQRPGAKAPVTRGPDTRGPDTKTPPETAAPVAPRTQLGGMPTIGRPERPQRPPAPGPTITRAPARPDTTPAMPPAPGQPAAPPAAPKQGIPEDKSVKPSAPTSPGRDKPDDKSSRPTDDDKAAPPSQGAPSAKGAAPDDRTRSSDPSTKPTLPPLRERSPQTTPKPQTPPPASRIEPKPAAPPATKPSQDREGDPDRAAPTAPKPPPSAAPKPDQAPPSRRTAQPPAPTPREAPEPRATPQQQPEQANPPPPPRQPRQQPPQAKPPAQPQRPSPDVQQATPPPQRQEAPPRRAAPAPQRQQPSSDEDRRKEKDRD